MSQSVTELLLRPVAGVRGSSETAPSAAPEAHRSDEAVMALPALLTAPQTQRTNVDLGLCRASAGSGVVVRGRRQAHCQRSAASARVRLQMTMPE